MPKTACSVDQDATMDEFVEAAALQHSDRHLKNSSRSSLASQRIKQSARVASKLTAPGRKLSSQNERDAPLRFRGSRDGLKDQLRRAAQNTVTRPKTIDKVSLVVKRFQEQP